MGSSARPFGPRLSSVANAPAPNFSPFRCPPRGLGHAALDSDHAERGISALQPALFVHVQYTSNMAAWCYAQLSDIITYTVRAGVRWCRGGDDFGFRLRLICALCALIKVKLYAHRNENETVSNTVSKPFSVSVSFQHADGFYRAEFR